ncbi:hypothetical protein DFJ74DRAFT_703751 [Hyaloraphidium curvatum]|nr:hypothetical protein DFJ74DRAFT_703751 [Hyaloraphidium curvatum]
MPAVKNTRCLYVTEPVNRAPELSDFKIVSEDLDIDNVAKGSVVTENLYVSLDPYLRGRMRQGVKSYIPPFSLNEPFVSHAVSRVAKSGADGFKEGDLVYLMGSWESYTVHKDASKVPQLKVLEPAKGIPLSYYIGVLGMPGMTAWAGLMVLAHPKAGETLFVSAASGAVGQVVVQYGKKMGMRVVGCAGSDEKCEWVKKELGADECLNYKKPPGGSIAAAVKAACPNGIDVNFENVGGEIYEAVLANMNKGGRVSVCGWITDYNKSSMGGTPERLEQDRVDKDLEYCRWFLVSAPEFKEHVAEQQKKTTEWILDGSMKVKEDIRDGLEQAPAAFIDMLQGGNFGKAVVRIKKE